MMSQLGLRSDAIRATYLMRKKRGDLRTQVGGRSHQVAQGIDIDARHRYRWRPAESP